VLLGLPHQIQVRMGSVTLLGQDLLNLQNGSVVPLNRAVGEPVDLMLDGKTIAQGEVVLINGRNLGVRIVALGS
jgi:flagellar motor switch protein FliN/FliY